MGVLRGCYKGSISRGVCSWGVVGRGGAFVYVCLYARARAMKTYGYTYTLMQPLIIPPLERSKSISTYRVYLWVLICIRDGVCNGVDVCT